MKSPINFSPKVNAVSEIYQKHAMHVPAGLQAVENNEQENNNQEQENEKENDNE